MATATKAAVEKSYTLQKPISMHNSHINHNVKHKQRTVDIITGTNKSTIA